MVVFAKIINTPTHQVLVTKDFGEGGTYVVEVKTSFPLVYPSILLGFDTREKRDKCFDEYDEAMADAFIQQVIEVIGEDAL